MNAYRGTGRRAAAAAVLTLALGATACGGDSKAEESKPADDVVVLAPQDVAAAQLTELAAGVVLTGSLDPAQTADVRAQVPGTVVGLRVDRGQPVARGQVMAAIDAQGIRSQAAGAQAGVAAAQAGLALARRQLESARTLYQAGAMSEIEFRGAQTQYEAAEAQLAAARSQATAAGEAAGRTTIRAPFAGEVSKRQVNEGEAVNPGQTLFTVVNSSVLELAGQIPVDEAARVRVGQPATFTLDAYPGREFRGTVARIEPTADPATRKLGVYLRLPNPKRELVGGLFATGRVLSEGAQQAVVVPEAAVRGQGAEAHVFVVQGGQLVRRPVTTGARDAARGVVAIERGVQAGEQVVVSPSTDIQAGTKVRVAAPQAAAQEGK